MRGRRHVRNSVGVVTLLVALGSGCEGGSAGLPPIPVSPLRVIQAQAPKDGSLGAVSDPYLQAVPIAGAAVSGAILSSVRFEVPVDQTYFLEVTSGPTPVQSGGTLVADVVFPSGAGSPDTSALFVDPSRVPIDLGELRLAGQVATPSTNPLDFVDADDDGVPDSQQANQSPLRVLRVDPDDGEAGVDRDESIEVRFSLAIDATTLTGDSARIEGPAGAIAIRIGSEGEDEGDEEAGRIEIRSLDPFAANTTFTLIVTTAVRSTDGRALEREFRSTFTTSADGGASDGSDEGESTQAVGAGDSGESSSAGEGGGDGGTSEGPASGGSGTGSLDDPVCSPTDRGHPVCEDGGGSHEGGDQSCLPTDPRYPTCDDDGGSDAGDDSCLPTDPRYPKCDERDGSGEDGDESCLPADPGYPDCREGGDDVCIPTDPEYPDC